MVRDAQCVRASDEFQMITLPKDSGVTRCAAPMPAASPEKRGNPFVKSKMDSRLRGNDGLEVS
jgi:hypothetical protein